MFDPNYNTAPAAFFRSQPDYAATLQQGFGGVADQLSKNRDYAAGLAETKARLQLGRDALSYRAGQDKLAQSNWEAEHDLALQKETWDEAHPNAGGGSQFWQPDPDKPGALKPTPGGPYDPATLAEQAKARSRTPGTKPLSTAYAGLVKEAGTDVYNITYSNNKWDDAYGGHTALGNLPMDLAKKGMGSEKMAQGADWWAQYRGYVQAIKRNRLYGAALTPQEKEEFDRSDIDPTMDPKRIRVNLQHQHDILTLGATKLAGQLAAGGVDPTQIEQGLHVRLDDLGFKIKRDPKTNRITEITEYPYIPGLDTVGTDQPVPGETDLGG